MHSRTLLDKSRIEAGAGVLWLIVRRELLVTVNRDSNRSRNTYAHVHHHEFHNWFLGNPVNKISVDIMTRRLSPFPWVSNSAYRYAALEFR